MNDRQKFAFVLLLADQAVKSNSSETTGYWEAQDGAMMAFVELMGGEYADLHEMRVDFNDQVLRLSREYYGKEVSA
jgi:hypothetical protein